MGLIPPSSLADRAPVIWHPSQHPVRVNAFSFGYLWHDNTLPHRDPGHQFTTVLDLRPLLFNPYRDPAMRERTGLDPLVRDYVLTTPGAEELLAASIALTRTALDWARDEQALLNIAFGCAGGRHRSVVFAAELCDQLNRDGIPTLVAHYDVRRPVYRCPADTNPS